MAIAILGVLIATTDLPANAAEDETFEVYTTPKGTYRLESAGGDETQVFVVMKSSGQREPLPDASYEDPTECTVIYGASPDENWIFAPKAGDITPSRTASCIITRKARSLPTLKARNGSRTR
jgi:hypothetical protein